MGVYEFQVNYGLADYVTTLRDAGWNYCYDRLLLTPRQMARVVKISQRHMQPKVKLSVIQGRHHRLSHVFVLKFDPSQPRLTENLPRSLNEPTRLTRASPRICPRKRALAGGFERVRTEP